MPTNGEVNSSYPLFNHVSEKGRVYFVHALDLISWIEVSALIWGARMKYILDIMKYINYSKLKVRIDEIRSPDMQFRHLRVC